MLRFPASRLTLAALTLLLIVTPYALAADPLSLGVRNPRAGDAQRETQVIASTGRDAYGTRQSNKGAGGGAIYGCRSSLDAQAPANPARSTPCIRVNNLRGGKAFDFVFDTGPIGGIIQAGGSLLVPRPAAAPFVTNATAVALGLNADRVDNMHASQIVAEARKKDKLDADTVDGLHATQIVAAAREGGGVCGAGFSPAGDACIETAPRPAAAFADAAAACGKDGRHLPTAALLQYARTLSEVDLGAGEMASDISATQSLPLPEPLADLTSATVYATVAENGSIDSATTATATPYRCAVG